MAGAERERAERRRAREALLADREVVLSLRARRRIGLRLPAKLPLLPPRRSPSEG
ncbi:MAG: hypothetical protein WCD35_13250 [Mycobacteriales bacterium]